MNGNIISVTPIIYNVTLTTAATEYSQLLPNGCTKFSVSILAGVSTDNFRIAFVPGKVATPTAPFLELTNDKEYKVDGLFVNGLTIFLASSATAAVAQIIAWT